MTVDGEVISMLKARPKALLVVSVACQGVPPWLLVPIRNPPDELVIAQDKVTEVTLMKS